jgi:hypothetical protein
MMLKLAALLAIAVSLHAQTLPKTLDPEFVVSCDPSACRHYYSDGEDFIILESKEARVAVALNRVILNPKYLSLTIGVSNLGDDPIDVVPSKFWVGVDAPKKDKLPYFDPERVAEANHGIDYATVMKVALQANTIEKGKTIAGSVFFKAPDKKAESVHAIIEVGMHIFFVPITLRKEK